MQYLVGDAVELYLAVAFFLGVIASYAFHRVTFLSLGGLISVGYLAGALVEPLDVLATLVLSLLSYWLLYNVVLRFVVLSNRRTFELGVATGMALGLVFELVVAHVLEGRGVHWGTMTIIGVMVPGLIAHEFKRQGIVRTLVPISAVVAVVGAVSGGVVLAARHLVPDQLDTMGSLSDALPVSPERLALAMVVSVVVAALVTDLVGWRSGGYVTAAVLALTVSGWESAAVLAGATAVTYGVVTLACRHLPVFGKQRLTIAILVSGIATMAAQLAVQHETGKVLFTGFVVIALVTPALVANDIVRVGLWRTGAGMATTGAAVAGALALTA